MLSNTGNKQVSQHNIGDHAMQQLWVENIREKFHLKILNQII